MKLRKILAVGLALAVVVSSWAPVNVFAVGSNPTMLDISQGNITITATGADGGGLTEAETSLNPDGYTIVSTGGTTANKIIVDQNVSTDIRLSNVSISVTGTNITPFEIRKDADVNLELDGSNTLTSAAGAGIGLVSTAKLHIDGEGSLAATGGNCGAIGPKTYTAALNGLIEINGGEITAVSTRGAGIGGTQGRSPGQIRINGGFVKATSNASNVAGIGAGRPVTTSLTPAVIINGGSVDATVQGTPVNELGDALTLVTATVTGGAGKVFTFKGANGQACKAKADSAGKLYLYLTNASGSLSVECGGDTYIGTIIGAEATLTKYEGASCKCTADTAEIVMEGGTVQVNDVIGERTIELTSSFKPAEACEYPQHDFAPEYSLDASVDAGDASISGRNLTVYAQAGGKEIVVNVSATVNEKKYTGSAVFTVTSSDTYEFDLADGNITVAGDRVTVGSRVYSVSDAAKPIRIFQSRVVANNRIEVAGGVSGRTIVFDNLSLTQTGLQLDSPVIIGQSADVVIELVGDNTVTVNSNSYQPAVCVRTDATLTIKGSGSLSATGGRYNVGIGGTYDAEPGDIIIESGKIKAVGGDSSGGYPAAAGIGAGPAGRPGTVTIKGGMVDAQSGIGGVNDIYANLVIDGGSVFPVNFSAEPRNSAGQRVYLVTLTMEEVAASSDITYYVQHGDAGEGSAISTSLGELGEVYFYLPADSEWCRLRARVNGDSTETDYYKRLMVSSQDANDGLLTKNPTGSINDFYIVGQNESEIDEANKTITVKIPDSIDLSSCTPLVDSGRLEYRPMGAVNFSTNPTQTYSAIKDDGTPVDYTTQIVREESDPNAPTILNIGAGNIMMYDDDTITVGDAPVVKNPNGYLIKGSSDKHHIYIGDITAPVVFEDLTVSAPELDEEGGEYAPLVIAGAEVTISVKGVNEITGAVGDPAIFVSEDAKAEISGEGILVLAGGEGAPGVQKEANSSRLVINGASIFIIDGGTADTLIPTDTANRELYPVEVTVDSDKAVSAVVKYRDNGGASEVSLLTNAEKKLSIYKPAGSYEMTVMLDGEMFSGQVEVTNQNSPAAPATVVLTTSKVTGLTFTDPQTGMAVNLEVTLAGTNIGGTVIVKATGKNGEEITAEAKPDRNKVWKATLALPENEDPDNTYRYQLSATINGEEQTLTGTTYVDMLRRMVIKTFTLDKYQLGAAAIDDDAKTVKLLVPYDVDLARTTFTPAVTHTGNEIFPPIRATSFLNPVSYELYRDRGDDVSKYTVTASKEPTPVVSQIAFVQPQDYHGGNVEITLTGENFESLANAVDASARNIVVSAAGQSVNAVKSGDQWKATVLAPNNEGGIQTMRYPITVTINGVQQRYTGTSEIVVAARIESVATLDSFELPEQLEITIQHLEAGQAGTINVTMPTGTDLKALTPVITTTNPKATYRLYNEAGDELAADEPIDFTNPVTLVITSEDTNNTKTYLITVTEQKKKRRSSTKGNVTTETESVESYISGYDDRTFRPDHPITRAEMASIFAKLDEGFSSSKTYRHEFFDVEAGAWYENAVAYLSGKNIVNGYEGAFRPNDNVTRMEFAAVVSHVMGDSETGEKAAEFSDISGLWGEDAIVRLAKAGIVSGYEDGTFMPNATITRAEAVTIMNRVLGRELTREVRSALKAADCPFRDVSSQHWAYDEIMNAVTDYEIVTTITKKNILHSDIKTEIVIGE